jgi:hypothetical protein
MSLTNIKRLLRQRKVQVALGIIAVLLGVRIALPFVVERYVNKTLDELDGYSGRIEDVDLNLWRGAYEIEGVQIVKTGGRVPAPFFSANQIDISVEWSALFDGSIVAEIELNAPQLNFVQGPTEKQKQVEPGSNWTEVVKDLAPFSINRFAIVGGEVHYRDFHSNPKVDIYVQNLNSVAKNLTNSEDLSGSLVASFEGRAVAMGSGTLRFDGKVDPYAKSPTFELNVKLDRLQLPQLNDYLRAYANVDAERGTFSLDAEFAASKGRFRGYVKPFIDDLQVLRWNQEEESLPNKLWQGLVDVAGEILEDQKRDRIATKVPFQGRLEDPEADVWATIGGLLRNGFIEALRRGVEGSIDITPREPSGS